MRIIFLWQRNYYTLLHKNWFVIIGSEIESLVSETGIEEP